MDGLSPYPRLLLVVQDYPIGCFVLLWPAICICIVLGLRRGRFYTPFFEVSCPGVNRSHRYSATEGNACLRTLHS